MENIVETNARIDTVNNNKLVVASIKLKDHAQFIRNEYFTKDVKGGYFIDNAEQGYSLGRLTTNVEGDLLIPIILDNPKRWFGKTLLLHFSAADDSGKIWSEKFTIKINFTE